MTHKKVRYSDILSGLEGFDDWLRRLGVPVQQSDRAHYAIRVVERAEMAFQTGVDTNTIGISKAEYLFALTEALELHDVYLALRNHDPVELRIRLTRALSGPALPDAETRKSSDGRNIMFELALAAEWSLRGASVALLEPDLLLEGANLHYFVACKRPLHDHTVPAALNDAASQLRSALSSAPKNHFGIIAISFSRILNHGNKFFSGTYEQLSDLLTALMTSNRSLWRKTRFHPRNIAVLFHAHTPADWGDGLFRMSASVMGPALEEEPVHLGLRDDMERLYRDTYDESSQT